MTLGERCDEIVRLIDETLVSCAPTSPTPAAPLRPVRQAKVRPRATEVDPDLAGVLARTA